MKSFTEVTSERVSKIKCILTDVDGVHTNREEGVSICELLSDEIHNGFVEVKGDMVRSLIPCDLHGVPERKDLQYISGKAGQQVFEIYRFHIPDGQAVIDLISRDLNVLLISGRNSACVRARADALGANAVLGVRKKYEWLKEQGWFIPASTLVISDNNADAELLKIVREAGGIAIAPADAEPEALAQAEFITEAGGGKGVVAEVAKALISVMDS